MPRDHHIDSHDDDTIIRHFAGAKDDDTVIRHGPAKTALGRSRGTWKNPRESGSTYGDFFAESEAQDTFIRHGPAKKAPGGAPRDEDTNDSDDSDAYGSFFADMDEDGTVIRHADRERSAPPDKHMCVTVKYLCIYFYYMFSQRTHTLAVSTQYVLNEARWR